MKATTRHRQAAAPVQPWLILVGTVVPLARDRSRLDARLTGGRRIDRSRLGRDLRRADPRTSPEREDSGLMNRLKPVRAVVIDGSR